MTIAVFYLITFIAAMIILCCMYLSSVCSYSRLMKDYQRCQLDKFGYVCSTLNIEELIQLIGSDRLLHCYGIKIHNTNEGDPILWTTCDWDINESLKSLYLRTRSNDNVRSRTKI